MQSKHKMAHQQLIYQQATLSIQLIIESDSASFPVYGIIRNLGEKPEALGNWPHT